MKRRVLAVCVPDAVCYRVDDDEWIHRLPEEMAGIEVHSQVWAELADAGERLEVEDKGAGMQLEADQ